ncbi:MAG: hypothetical protein HQL84_00830 [Magnetococcales bacterium]|nr:hypothetical protein [Magnetococcales bacterium]MBF0148573.1 hypothetical protein [Magnetococcales bacterium]MBF0172297.1 hypothetical protein [Magnetococcales bacterium]MBF0347302.1 hypothetical protein [Magnetococcales bacterium]MBF0629734.1 hypothetical protein [Magnetococcales bacterium]
MNRRTTRHSSLTEKAALLCKALRKAGFHPHPGPINARGRGGGDCRVKISSDSGRIRLRVTGHGVQEVFLYGPVDLDRLVQAIDTMGVGVRIESVVETIKKKKEFPPSRG